MLVDATFRGFLLILYSFCNQISPVYFTVTTMISLNGLQFIYVE